MEEFYLFDEKRIKIPIGAGFPDNYKEAYGFPGTVKCHAYFGKYPLLFQRIKVGKYTIAMGDYLTRNTGKLTCYAKTSSIEMHFILTGNASFKLRNLGWLQMKAPAHNMIAIHDVKNETYFKITPVSTFDIHFSLEDIIRFSKKYSKLRPLITALQKDENKALNQIPVSTNLLMLDLIFQIRAAFDAGEENLPSTEELVERLIIMVLDATPIPTKYNYDYSDIEKLHRAHRLITQYLDEKNILENKIKESNIKPDKFREGFHLLFDKLPGLYLHEERLKKAHILAIEGRSTTIEDIAQLCGYYSSNHLSKAFFKFYGEKISTILQQNRKNSR